MRIPLRLYEHLTTMTQACTKLEIPAKTSRWILRNLNLNAYVQLQSYYLQGQLVRKAVKQEIIFI